MKEEELIGRLVEITDKESDYEGHWGYVYDWDGEVYHVSGGSISSDSNPSLIPIFDRDQFVVPRKANLSRFKGNIGLWNESWRRKRGLQPIRGNR